jgi:diguanylate cyclase (GGDEF)-like protein
VRAYLGVPLRSRDGENIGTICAVDMKPRSFDAAQIALMSDLAQMVMDELELRSLAMRDQLTGAYSRRAFKQELQRATLLALRHDQELSLVMFDLDHFKTINDTYGHPAGDAVLASVGINTAKELRRTDLLGRLGGEEFGLLLPSTGVDPALGVAEMLRDRLERQPIDIPLHEPIFVTASFGVAALGADARDADTLWSNADQALYAAKHAGRNGCAAWQSSPARTISGRRVLKAGQIAFNGNDSVIDCTVRALSTEGAAMDLSDPSGVPDAFTLTIKADGVSHACRVLSRRLNHVEVAFD